MYKGASDMQELIATLNPHLKSLLSAENFKTSVNFPQVLALIGFFCQAAEYLKDPSYFIWMIQNDHINGYLNT